LFLYQKLINLKGVQRWSTEVNYGWITLKLTAKAVGTGGRSPSQSILKPVLEKIDTGACICSYKVFISMRNCVKFWPGFSSLDPTT